MRDDQRNIILGLLAFQALFGLLVMVVTGSSLLPPLLGSVGIAIGMWFPLTVTLLIYAVANSDREAPIASTRLIFGQHFGRLVSVLAVLVAFAVSFSLINWTKAMIPAFTADAMLADLDARLFGTDPWRLFDIPALRWTMAKSYAFWFPVIYGFMVWAAFSRKTLAILSMFTIAAIDTVAHFALPSAGPIFWSRLGMGDRFADLENGPSTYTFFSDLLWHHYESGTVAAGTGISAMPSMHVALSAWLVLSFPKVRLLTVPFLMIVFAASVASGWHYFTDGLAGCAMAYAAHRLVRLRRAERLSPQVA
jgi:hypothetical protein